MKSFTDLINESKFSIREITFDTYEGTAGSSLAKEFTFAQNNKFISFMEKNKAKFKFMLDSLSDPDYSDTMVVTYKNFKFSMYARDGMFRVGGGSGNTTEINVLRKDFDIDEFLKDLV